MRSGKHISYVIAFVFRALLLTAGIIAIFRADWIYLFLSWFTLFLTFLPAIVAREFRFNIPNEFEVALLLFIYASMYLGEMRFFYAKFWWWDIFLHGNSAIMIGGIGFMLVYILNREGRVAIKLSPFFVAVFAFCFALAMGTLWEIIEFSLDSWFGLNMQKSGLEDTMWDLIVDTMGALLVSYIGYLYMHKDIRFFQKLEQRLLKHDRPSNT